MGESTRLLKGIFKDGLIVPDPGMAFGDGTPVAFHALPVAFTPEEQAEFDAWQSTMVAPPPSADTTTATTGTAR